MTTSCPLPPHYDPANAARWGHRPDAAALLAAAGPWARAHGITAAAADPEGGRVHLLLIDPQKDFSHPEGSLFVGGRSGRGAVEDNDRLARFIYRNIGRITTITCTLDTHFPHQIFFPSFWLDAAGNTPPAHTLVTSADLAAGRLRPNPALAPALADGDVEWLQRQAESYCAELERAGRYALYLWPPHCLLGSEGHALVGVIEEARLFHSFARTAQAPLEIKGTHPLTENYSALAPEVLHSHDGKLLAPRNDALIKTLLEADTLIIAGQAASHCVKSTVDDLLAEILATDPALARKVCILRDGMSAVAVPDPGNPGAYFADFTPQAEAALEKYAAAGMRVLDCEEW